MESKQNIASVVLTMLQKVLCLYNGIRFLSLVKSWDNITFFVFFVIFLFIVSHYCFQVSEV